MAGTAANLVKHGGHGGTTLDFQHNQGHYQIRHLDPQQRAGISPYDLSPIPIVLFL